MNLNNILKKALKKKFKAASVLRSIEQIIEKSAESHFYEMHKDQTFHKDNMEYELVDVKAKSCNYSLKIGKITITLVYFCKSKLPKIKREKINSVKAHYEKYKGLPYNTYNVPLWYEIKYKIELDRVLSGDCRLNVESFFSASV